MSAAGQGATPFPRRTWLWAGAGVAMAACATLAGSGGRAHRAAVDTALLLCLSRDAGQSPAERRRAQRRRWGRERATRQQASAAGP